MPAGNHIYFFVLIFWFT